MFSLSEKSQHVLTIVGAIHQRIIHSGIYEAITIHDSWDVQLFHNYLYLQKSLFMQEIYCEPNMQDDVKLKQWYFHTLLSQL